MWGGAGIGLGWVGNGWGCNWAAGMVLFGVVCTVGEIGKGSGGMEDKEPEDNALDTASS